MPRFILFCVALSLSVALAAQNLYTVKVGTFRDVKAVDFAALQAKGFVYGIPAADNTTDVYLGHYAAASRANATTAELNASGFRNAKTFNLPLTSGQSVTVIQIALTAASRPVNWAELERAGQLFVESIDGTTKILTGIYPDARTAASFLPAIRELGYTDAFVRTVNNVRLIPVTTFETGIKKPLIPINLQAAKNTVPLGTPPPTSEPASPKSPPTTYGSSPPPLAKTPTPNAPTPTAVSATSPAFAYPTIDEKTKRHSAAELQKLLKAKGYYEGSIDGYYGPGTTAAYKAAWNGMPEIHKYRKLSEMLIAPSEQYDFIKRWPEVKTLLAVVNDLSAGLTNATLASQLVQQRAQLTNATQALSTNAAERVKNWSATLWQNMDDWATDDPLHAQIYNALRLTYQQSHVRLEDYYMDRGLSATAARDLAAAMLQNLTGAQLDRFF